jgi:hypothetical protein
VETQFLLNNKLQSGQNTQSCKSDAGILVCAGDAIYFLTSDRKENDYENKKWGSLK